MGGATRGTHGRRGVGIGKGHALACQAVEVGSENLSAVGTGFVFIIVIDQENQEVGLASRGRGRDAAEQDNCEAEPTVVDPGAVGWLAWHGLISFESTHGVVVKDVL